MPDTTFPPEHLDSLFASIAGAIACGDADTALDLCDSVLMVAPDRFEAGVVKAEVLAGTGRADEAAAVLESIAAHHGERSVVWQRLGDVSLRRGDSERAVEACRQWQRLEGPTVENETALALAYLADLDLARARVHADAAVAADATDGPVDLVERLSNIDDNAGLQAEAGWWFAKLGATDRARQLLTASLDQDDRPETHRRLAATLTFAGRSTEALPHLRAAVQAAPEQLEWKTELGTALLVTGDVDGAASCFDEVLVASPDHPAATIGAGRVAIQRNEPRQALELIDRRLGTAPNDSQAWIVRSTAHLAAEQPTKALIDAELAISSAPTERESWATAANAATAAGSDVLAHRYMTHSQVHLSGSLGMVEGDDGLDDLPHDITDELRQLDPIVVGDQRVRGIYAARAHIADILLHASRAVAYVDAAIERGALETTPELLGYRAALQQPEPAPNVPIEPDRGPWVPSHESPPNGTPAFHHPGGKEPPVADLQPGLPVQLVERSREWGHVRCENDWECWVDLTLLVPIEDSWTATHRVPSSGMASRTTPYPNADDAGGLAAELEVDVISRTGGWAHVRFENGWSCWVADEPLEPLP